VTAFILAEMALALIATVAFVVLYAVRSPWRGTAMWRVPTWVYALVFGALDLVVLQRLWLLIRAQRDR
jgi:hypothetical protein